jgi:REP element-mobilizing transposase RayT
MAYHAVWHTLDGVGSLRSSKSFRQVRDSCRRCHDKAGFRVVHFAVEPNHVHVLVEADDTESLSRGMQGLGVAMSKRINRSIGRRGKLFGDRFFARPLRTPTEVAKAINYVLHNGEIHERRLGVSVDRHGAPDPVSSAALPDSAALTSPAKTWLLATGWQRARPTRGAG